MESNRFFCIKSRMSNPTGGPKYRTSCLSSCHPQDRGGTALVSSPRPLLVPPCVACCCACTGPVPRPSGVPLPLRRPPPPLPLLPLRSGPIPIPTLPIRNRLCIVPPQPHLLLLHQRCWGRRLTHALI